MLDNGEMLLFQGKTPAIARGAFKVYSLRNYRTFLVGLLAEE